MIVSKMTILGGGLIAGWAALCLPPLLTHSRSISSQQSKPNPERERRRAQQQQLVQNAFLAWQRDKDLPKAERLFRQALKQDDACDDAWLSLARIMDSQSRHREALVFYDSFLGPHRWKSSLENEPAVLTRYAELCDQFGRSDDATRAYRKVLVNAARNGDNHWLDTNMSVSVDAQEPNDIRARAYLIAGIAHQWHQEAIIFAESEEDSRAVAAYRRAAHFKPDLAIAHWYLASGLEQAGRKPEAKLEFARAERLGSPDFRFAMHKRENEEKQRFEAAKKTWRAVDMPLTTPGIPVKFVNGKPVITDPSFTYKTNR